MRAAVVLLLAAAVLGIGWIASEMQYDNCIAAAKARAAPRGSVDAAVEKLEGQVRKWVDGWVVSQFEIPHGVALDSGAWQI